MPTFQIRLSVQERERLGELARAEKLTMSALIRKRVGLESQPPDRPSPAEFVKAVLPQPVNTLLTCPMPGCLYHAQSSKARCPVHNRQVR